MADFLSTTGIGPKSFNRHLEKRKNRNSKFRKMMLASLMLTPMVDMFSLLVIFLLQSFSASPELPFKTEGLVLPTAAHSDEVQNVPILALTREDVFLGPEHLGKIKAVLDNPKQLVKRLGELRAAYLKVRKDVEFSGEINVQADKDLPSTTISEFLGILSYEAYGQYYLTVARESSNAR